MTEHNILTALECGLLLGLYAAIRIPQIWRGIKEILSRKQPSCNITNSDPRHALKSSPVEEKAE